MLDGGRDRLSRFGREAGIGVGDVVRCRAAVSSGDGGVGRRARHRRGRRGRRVASGRPRVAGALPRRGPGRPRRSLAPPADVPAPGLARARGAGLRAAPRPPDVGRPAHPARAHARSRPARWAALALDPQPDPASPRARVGTSAPAQGLRLRALGAPGAHGAVADRRPLRAHPRRRRDRRAARGAHRHRTRRPLALLRDRPRRRARHGPRRVLGPGRGARALRGAPGESSPTTASSSRRASRPAARCSSTRFAATTRSSTA